MGPHHCQVSESNLGLELEPTFLTRPVLSLGTRHVRRCRRGPAQGVSFSSASDGGRDACCGTAGKCSPPGRCGPGYDASFLLSEIVELTDIIIAGRRRWRCSWRACGSQHGCLQFRRFLWRESGEIAGTGLVPCLGRVLSVEYDSQSYWYSLYAVLCCTMV